MSLHIQTEKNVSFFKKMTKSGMTNGLSEPKGFFCFCFFRFLLALGGTHVVINKPASDNKLDQTMDKNLYMRQEIKCKYIQCKQVEQKIHFTSRRASV